jgi:hypothetical protein
MRRARLGLLVVLVLVLLGGVAYAVLRYYLASPQVTAQVQHRLEALYGAPVEVSRAEIGWHGSALHGLKLYEAGASRDQAPWATVDTVKADVSAPGLAQGREQPQHLELIGAALTLRFDAQGRLLTRLPSPKGKATALPEIDLRDSQLTLAQEGKPDLVLHGITAKVQSQDGQLVLSGSLQDPHWGRWDLGGRFDQKSGEATGTVKTDHIHLTMPELQALPFIGAGVWAAVRAEGDTPVELTLSHDGKSQAVHYRVALRPVNATVDVTSIDLHADQASGSVWIADRVVRLKDVQGKTADGVLRLTDGVLDFSKAPNRLTFDLAADGLLLKQLPKKWKLPPQLSGRLKGEAHLVVTIRDGKAHTSGDGQGVITDARVAGFKAEPITLRLHSDEGGFHFTQQGGGDQSRAPAALPATATVGTAVLADPPEAARAPGAADVMDPATLLSGRTLSWFADTVLRVPGAFTDAGARLLSHVPRQLPRAAANAPKKPTSYLDANLTLQDVDLAQLIHGLNLHLPVPVTGHASLKVRVSFPVNTPQDLKAYRVQGSAQSPRLTIAGVELRHVQARLHYDNGVLHLDELDGRVPPAGKDDAEGSFRGSARMGVVPAGDLTARLALTDIPLAQAVVIVPELVGQAAGAFSGNVEARVATKRLRDVAAWAATGHLTGDRLVLAGQTWTDARADLRLEGGVLSATNVAGKLDGEPMTGSGDLHLSRPYRYHARLDVRRLDLDALQHLAPGARPPFTTAGRVALDATVEGTLVPLTWQAGGTARVQELQVDTFRATDVRFRWDSTTDRIDVKDLRAKLYGGELTGSAAVPLAFLEPAPADAGKGREKDGRVDLDFKDVDVGALSTDLFRAGATTPAGQTAAKPPFRLEGQANGSIRATLTPPAPGRERDLNARVELHSPRLRVQGFLTERLQGTIRYDKGAVVYKLEGATLGGKFQLEGQVPVRPTRSSAAPADGPSEADFLNGSASGGACPRRLRAEKTAGASPAARRTPPEDQLAALVQAAPADAPGGGRLRIQGAQIGQLWEQLGVRPGRVPLRGTLDLDLPFRQDSLTEAPTGVGTFTLSRLRWNGTPLAGTLRGEVRLTRREVRLANLGGTVGEGLLRGQVALSLLPAGRSWFNLALDNAEASRLLAPWPALASRTEGPVSLRARGTLGRHWAVTGQATLLRGRVAGVEVNEWQLPFEVLFAPRSGNGELTVRDSTAAVARGRATGSGTFTWGAGSRLAGSVRFSRLELGALARQVSDLGQTGRGRLTGRVDFGGTDLRSVNDVTATLQATFQEAQPRGFPVLQQLVPFLGPGASATSFRSGDFRARLANGIVRIQRLTLLGNNVQLFADGTVTLEGRLNLEVTANTGQLGINPRFLQLLGLRLPAFGPLPLSLVLEASTYLSNRTVHLRVVGTIRSPIIRVEPVSLLSEEAVRFFINRSPLPVP